MEAAKQTDLMTPAQKLHFHLQFMGVMGMAGREDERRRRLHQGAGTRAATGGRWPLAPPIRRH
jgi:hypothetical protein